MRKHDASIFDNSKIIDWNCRDGISNKLILSGFSAHVIFQNAVLEYCSGQKYEFSIHDYWNEVAKEFISSGGRDPERSDRGSARSRLGFYRSDLLDALEAGMVDGQPCGDVDRQRFLPEVHPCIRKFKDYCERNDDFVKNLNENVENILILEKKIFKLSHKIEKKISLNKLFSKIANEFGFENTAVDCEITRSTKYVFSRKAHNGIEFYTFIDKIIDGNDKRNGFFSAPLCVTNNSIDVYKDQSFGDLSIIIPGIGCYWKRIIGVDGFHFSFYVYFLCITLIIESLGGNKELR